MSKETSTWLNQNTLIGFTEKRGEAWHYRATDQGEESNHYAGAVPVEDVQRRLFNWQAVETPLFVPDGNGGYRELPNRKAMLRSDNGHDMGVFRETYQGHDYNEWLLGTVGNILDDYLAVGSAGLLKGGAVAWVSVEMPENLKTASGVEYRPHLLATTSFDGSLATTFKPVIQNVVCDNTMTMALGEDGARFKVKHSRNSGVKIQEARDALGLVQSIGDDFAAEVEMLTNQPVSNEDFERLVDDISPLPKITEGESTRGLTMAENKRDTLWRLWNNDERVSPWTGTAYGAWQALNTYQQHESIVRGAQRAERNMLNAVNGAAEKADAESMTAIRKLIAV